MFWFRCQKKMSSQALRAGIFLDMIIPRIIPKVSFALGYWQVEVVKVI